MSSIAQRRAVAATAEQCLEGVREGIASMIV